MTFYEFVLPFLGLIIHNKRTDMYIKEVDEMKRSLRIAIVLLLALVLLAACGRSVDKDENKTSDESKQEEKKDTKKDEPKKDKDESKSKQDENKENKKESSADAEHSKSDNVNEKGNKKEEKKKEQSQKEKEKGNDKANKKDANDTKDKDKQDSSQPNYKQDAVFHFTMNDGVDVYVYSANAKEETVKEDSACASAGQKIQKGDYSLVSINDKTNETHKLPIGEASFTKDSTEANIIKGDPELLLLSMCQGSDLYTSQTFVMTSTGELKAVKDTDGETLDLDVKPDLIKSTGKNKYQMAVFTNVDPDTNWYFYDLTLDPKTYKMSTSDKIVPSDLRNFDMREWKKDPNYKL